MNTTAQILKSLMKQGFEIRIGRHMSIEGFYVELVPADIACDGDDDDEGSWDEAGHGITLESALYDANRMLCDPDYDSPPSHVFAEKL